MSPWSWNRASGGIETSNLYTAFLALTARLLEPGGELTAITPRSFCNGSYFRSFRIDFLHKMAVDRVHVFNSRDRAFEEDDVLQENVIFHAVREQPAPASVAVSSSDAPEGAEVYRRDVPYAELVRPADPDATIYLAPDELDQRIADEMAAFSASLPELGIDVSTGRVVDFRAKASLRAVPEPGTVPLIYPSMFEGGYVAWPPARGRKATAIANIEDVVLSRVDEILADVGGAAELEVIRDAA